MPHAILFSIFFDDLHLQIIASISPKASVENSSAQWAIFLLSFFVVDDLHLQIIQSIFTGSDICLAFVNKAQ